MTFAVVVASYPSRRRGDTPIRRRRRTSGRVIIGVCSGGRRRRFNDRHLVSRLSRGAETTLGRYLNHSRTKRFYVLFFTLVSSIKKDLRREVVCNLFTRGKKERERKMKTLTREKVKEGKIRFQKQKVLALFSQMQKKLLASKCLVFSLSNHHSFRGISLEKHRTTH